LDAHWRLRNAKDAAMDGRDQSAPNTSTFFCPLGGLGVRITYPAPNSPKVVAVPIIEFVGARLAGDRTSKEFAAKAVPANPGTITGVVLFTMPVRLLRPRGGLLQFWSGL